MSHVINNYVLIFALTAWSLAQAIKVPLEYLRTKEWNWSLLFRVGGMPSSHSALVAATSNSIGLIDGFDTPLYALSVVIAIVVIYDATGIRRQAGMHATIINAMIRDLASGHPLREEQLREVLGHTPLEALAGMILGLVVSTVLWFIWAYS
jgi:acid phosphatase family membrane protein YuiD